MATNDVSMPPTARKADLWQQISNLLREYENAQIESAKAEIAANYDSLRQRLQVLALEDDMPPEVET